MTKTSYSELLRDPRWQKKRLTILERDQFSCAECGNTKKTLHVHHRYYVSGRLPWEYPGFCYQTLCKPCHDRVKTLAEERRIDGFGMFEDWEFGLDYFGGRIFDMATEDAEKQWPGSTSQLSGAGP